jgi:hypothetical protein
VVTPRLPSGKCKSWDPRIRPLPPNIHLHASVDEALGDFAWDWILTHNVNDLLDTRRANLPKVFLVHGTLSGRMAAERIGVERGTFLKGVRTLVEAYRCRVVYISALKQRDWGLPGEVIRTAINPLQYGGYQGSLRAVLQVGNHLKERGAVLGWEAHMEICHGLPSLVLGDNPGLPGSKVAESWEALKNYYRQYRLYLNTSIYPFEDGYNLALLEAMATGMPIATLKHPTSPVEDGVQGVVGTDAAELRRKVLGLLDDPCEAARMGAEARYRLEQMFPVQEFQSGWRELADRL